MNGCGPRRDRHGGSTTLEHMSPLRCASCPSVATPGIATPVALADARTSSWAECLHLAAGAERLWLETGHQGRLADEDQALERRGPPRRVIRPSPPRPRAAAS